MIWRGRERRRRWRSGRCASIISNLFITIGRRWDYGFLAAGGRTFAPSPAIWGSGWGWAGIYRRCGGRGWGRLWRTRRRSWTICWRAGRSGWLAFCGRFRQAYNRLLPMTHQTITRYAQGGQELANAIAGLHVDELLAFPIPGTWSIQQIVLHLMDSDLIAADRMKRIIAEENPSLIGYDESKFAANLFYNEQSADEAVRIFDMNRRQFVRVLERLPASAFDREG